MVDFARIQNRIYYGYGKAAIRLGTSHTIYRSANGINPIQSSNLIGTQLIGVDQDYTYTKTKKYGDPVWQILPQDGTVLQVYDYIVGSTVTYFIVDIFSEDRLSPPVVVECNAVISSLIDPINTLTPGTNAAYQQLGQQNTQILQNCPCSILQSNRTESNTLHAPSSVKLPYYDIILPDFDDVIIKTGELLFDLTNNRKLAVIGAERTKRSLGFRIKVALEGT